MNINEQLAQELNINVSQVDATVKLIDEGNTIPFIARYRKEVTGALNDEVLRNLFERLTYLRNLEDRKNAVLASIEEQGKLTDELKEQIMAATTLVVVEDLYRPYKQKKRTRATVAKEKGLEPLANFKGRKRSNSLPLPSKKTLPEIPKKKNPDGPKSIWEMLRLLRDSRAYLVTSQARQRKFLSTAEKKSMQEFFRRSLEALRLTRIKRLPLRAL